MGERHVVCDRDVPSVEDSLPRVRVPNPHRTNKNTGLRGP